MMPYTDSVQQTVTLPGIGVWLHDPDAPETTSANFQFGASQRSDDLDSMAAGAFYAGRAHPVFDFGEHESDAVACVIDIPHGETYRSDLATLRAFATLKRAVYYRDNRGRVYFGPMQGFKVTDQDWGAQVSFGIEQAHVDVVEAVASLTEIVGP